MDRRRSMLVASCLALAGCAVPGGFAPPLLREPPALLAMQTRPAPSGYYAGTDGLSGQALLQALKARISSDHQALSYNDARDAMFADVDDFSNTNTVFSVYTGRRGTGITDRKTADRQDFATEHTWPQSLGAGWSAAKSDLHHLFPVDNGPNSVRGNNPFGDVVTVQKTLPDQSGGGQPSLLGTDAAKTQVFEPPDRHKGNVARALMYFYVRYALPKPGEKGPGPLSLRNYRREAKILLAWHRQDPVNAVEMRRNDVIFARQGNRNPFVDRPDFAERAGTSFSALLDGEGD